jgi:hypothetical protein
MRPRSRTASPSSTSAAPTPNRRGLVNELALYHEVHGTGRPLVLLHGAMSTIETSFGEVLPAFAETR